MAAEREELFVTQVGVGVATMDASTDDGVVNARVVVEEVTANDKSGEPHELVLVYDAHDMVAVADGLKQAAEQAVAGE